MTPIKQNTKPTSPGVKRRIGGGRKGWLYNSHRCPAGHVPGGAGHLVQVFPGRQLTYFPEPPRKPRQFSLFRSKVWEEICQGVLWADSTSNFLRLEMSNPEILKAQETEGHESLGLLRAWGRLSGRVPYPSTVGVSPRTTQVQPPGSPQPRM